MTVSLRVYVGGVTGKSWHLQAPPRHIELSVFIPICYPSTQSFDKRQSTKMYGYIDETGNTGRNLFDDQQPVYITGALITRANFDLSYGANLKTKLDKHDIQELHANEIGFRKLELVAPDLLQILRHSDASFALSVVEKKYLLATKVVDSIFDSGENPSVPWDFYNLRPLRMMLVFKLSSLLCDDLAKNFWSILMERNKAKLLENLKKFCEAILVRVPELPDAHSRQLFTDAFQWVKENPDGPLIFTQNRHDLKQHMPNTVAFSNLLRAVDQVSKIKRCPRTNLVHDSQHEFSNTLAFIHKFFANAPDEQIHHAGETYTLSVLPGSSFEMVPDENSLGVQIADTFLWLYRRHTLGKDIPPNSRKLLDFSLNRTLIEEFTFDGVHQRLMEQLACMEEPSPSAINGATELAQEYRNASKLHVDQYKVDGLRPFERETMID
ncbi:MAG: DUF3800 domain-containing protein [Rhodobiaceae bacterium]|nr:DUF3800 domain-containing protein [Rhodobiaceae bacterium]